MLLARSPVSNSYAHGYTNGFTHSDADAHSHANADANTYANPDAHANTNSDPHSDAWAESVRLRRLWYLPRERHVQRVGSDGFARRK